MTKLVQREKWMELVAGLAAATAAAAGVWALGLLELVWLPYVLVAAESARRSPRRGTRPVRGGARS